MIGALAGLVLWGTAAASPAGGPPPLDAFFAKPVVNGLRLSPSGRYLASIQKRGAGQAVVVLDRQTGDQQVVTYASSDHIGFDWIEWKDDNRLLLRTWLYEVQRAGNKPDGPITGFRYGRFVEATDRDGKHLTVMFQNSPIAEQHSAPFIGFLDLLPKDPGHVLVTAPDANGFSSVWKVDIATGDAVLVEAGSMATVGWGVDGEGAVVERTELRNGMLSFQAKDPTAGWVEVERAQQKNSGTLSDFEILGPAPGAGQVYVAVAPQTSAEGEARTLRIFDFASRTLSEPQWPALKYDISGIVYRPGGAELAGVCYIADVYTCDFKDPAMQAAYRGLSRYFHGERNLGPVSLSLDGKVWALSVTGADAPGAYYLFDADEKSVSLVAERYPDLASATLGQTETYEFEARDGTTIPAYLIAPPGEEDAPAPTVVLVHGGPQARDSLDFDALTQFLATRGYLVFKPNFRGSGGYGRAWAQAGIGQWGGLMQDDVTDGVKALIADGRADPERICIIGGDYGGYAALQAGATESDLYKCVAAWGAPTDLAALARWEKKQGTPQTRRAASPEASPINHVADYDKPVLLIHGDQDDVVPIDQARTMAAALAKGGDAVRLVVLDGEGHADFSEAHTEQMFTALLDFLNEHIGEHIAEHVEPDTPHP